MFPRQKMLLGLAGMAMLCGFQFQPAAIPTPVQSDVSVNIQVAPSPVPVTYVAPGKVDEKNFRGIGSYVAADASHDNRVTVVQPLAGTPAVQAGLQSGDVITDIDGTDAVSVPLEQAVEMIRGEEGTIVHLSIYRPSNEEHFDVDITRAMIHVAATTP